MGLTLPDIGHQQEVSISVHRTSPQPCVYGTPSVWRDSNIRATKGGRVRIASESGKNREMDETDEVKMTTEGGRAAEWMATGWLTLLVILVLTSWININVCVDENYKCVGRIVLNRACHESTAVVIVLSSSGSISDCLHGGSYRTNALLIGRAV